MLEFFTLRFNDYQFWKNDVSRHRYILDRFLKELNGLITEEQSRYPAKLLECGMPLAAVRGIADSEAHGQSRSLVKNILTIGRRSSRTFLPCIVLMP